MTKLMPSTVVAADGKVWRESATALRQAQAARRTVLPMAARTCTDFRRPWPIRKRRRQLVQDVGVSGSLLRVVPTVPNWVPAQGAAVSLNDLAYYWPAVFARSELQVRDPGRGWLSPDETAQVSTVLGITVRQFLSHY
ncbi:hypothetical protein [Micromonospora palythoicola]|uniref:hypothetical protein n=1 Tax=Micromonospora palythoicola TaxID=3120507 RepID=UPI002FCDF0B9